MNITNDQELVDYIKSIKPSGATIRMGKYVKGPGEDGMATTIQLGPDKTLDPTIAFGVEDGNPVLIYAYGPTMQIKALGKLLGVTKIDKTGDPKNDTSRIDYSATNARPFPVVKDIKKVFDLMKKIQSLNEAPSMAAKKKVPNVSAAAKKASAEKKADAARAKALAPIPGSGRPYDAPIFRKLNAMRPKPGYEVDGGPKTAKALEILTKKHGPEYAAACFEAAVDLTYTGYYSSQAYDGEFGNDSYEFEKDVTDLSNIHSKEWASEDSWVKENKTTTNEVIGSLGAYYKVHGPGEGEFSFRQAVEEIDGILIQIKNNQLREELLNAITDAIDMAYDLGVEGYGSED